MTTLTGSNDWKSCYKLMIKMSQNINIERSCKKFKENKICRLIFLSICVRRTMWLCACMLYLFRGDAAIEKVPGLRGVPFFGVDFYCIFDLFGKMTHLVNFKKCRGSSPGCPGWCGAPDTYYIWVQKWIHN